jgi:two-component system LytT family sensor kinase
MNQLKRFLFQVVLWLVVWLTSWFFLGENFQFLKENGLAFVLQIFVIAVLIFYTAPALLFKKKYILFIVVSIGLLLLCTFIIPTISGVPDSGMGPGPGPRPGPGMGPPPGPDMNISRGMQRKPPPKFLINLLILSVSYIAATFIETFLFAQKKEEEIIVNKNEALQTELKLLKSQINPHFLFNSLNNIYALSVINSGKTQQSIGYLSDMLRYVLYECEQELVPLEKEITYLTNYIKLFELKSSKQYPIEVDFKVVNQNIKIAPMLFIPFMENALKHGNIEKIKDVFIRMKIDADADKVLFEIENSKPQGPVVKDEVGGIGIENVKKRLAIVYPNRHELLINETSQAFKVNLKIDLYG